MTSPAPAAMPSVEDVARAWNSIADEHNRWSCLSLDERADFTKFAAALFTPILAEKESLRRELHSLAVALHRKHYWHVKQWKPFDDALGLATQIDNMTAGLVPEARALAAEAALAAERERAARIAEDYGRRARDSRQPSTMTDALVVGCGQIAAAIRAEGE